MSKKLKKAISILATFMSGLGGPSNATQNEVTNTSISSSESGDVNAQLAALSVAGDAVLKNSTENNEKKDNDDLNYDILNDVTLQEEGIDPAVLDRLELKNANLPSPPHIGAVWPKDSAYKINHNDSHVGKNEDAPKPIEVANTSISSSESGDVNVKLAALSVAGNANLKNSTEYNEKKDNDDLNSDILNDETLQEEGIDPAVLDRLELKNANLPSPPHTVLDNTVEENVTKLPVPISFKPDVDQNPAPTPLPNIVSSSWEKIYEEPNPDFTGITSCGVDNDLISSFYDLQQDSLVLKNKKQVLEYSSDSNLYQEVSFKLDNNVNSIIDIIKQQKTKLLSGDQKTVTSRVKKLVKFYHTLNNAINKCIQSLKDKDLSEKTRSEIDAAVHEYVENPRMKLWWYKGKDNLCPFNNVVAKLGEAKLILLYTDLLLTSIGSSDATPHGISMDDEENVVDKVDKETEELKSIITADDPFFNYKSINSSNKDDELFRDMAAEVEEDF